MRAKSRLAPSVRRPHPGVQRPPLQPYPASEDEAFVAARRGDLSAWEWIARRHQELVFRSAYLATRDSILAEETTREVLTRAYRTLGSLEAGAEVRPWLMRLTDVVARTRLREMTHRRDARLPEREPCPRVAASPVRLLQGTPRPTPAEQVALIEAFDGLIDEDRMIIAARYAFELGRDTAATRLGLKPFEVDERLSASLARLRRRVAEIMAVAPVGEARKRLRPVATGRIASLTDDQLGSSTMTAVISELPWTPDVGRIVCERLAREAVAYPATSAMVEGGDQRPLPPARAAGAAVSLPGRVGRRRGRFTLRSVGLLAGLSLVGVSFAVSSGAAVGGWPIPVELRSGIDAMLGTPASSQAPAMSAGASESGASGMGSAPRGDQAPSTESVLPATVASAPAVSVVGVRRLERGALKAVVRVAWPMPDAVTRARLERSPGDDEWTAGAWADAVEPLLTVMRPGVSYRFRVRATDVAGRETISEVSRVTLTVRGPRSERLTRSGGGWQIRPGPSGGPRLVSVTPGAVVSTEFRGSGVALVGRDDLVSEPVSVRLDGGPWDSEPGAGDRLGRWVLFSEELDQGQHSIEVRAPVDGLGIDAVLILRSLQT